MSDLDHTDALAAEYVLGTLDADERAQARALLAADTGFAARVQFWERRLGELHLMVEPVEPEREIWPRIKARMLEPQAPPAAPLPEPPEPEPAPTVLTTEAPAAEAPTLDAIEAVIVETTTTLTERVVEVPASEAAAASEAPPAPIADTIPISEAPAPPSDEPSIASAGLTPAPQLEMPLVESATEPAAAPSPPPPPVAVPALEPEERPAPPVESQQAVMVVHRRLRRWRAFAILLALAVAAVVALLAAWRFAPDRVPSALQPLALMQRIGIALPAPAPPPRRPPPPSQYQE